MCTAPTCSKYGKKFANRGSFISHLKGHQKLGVLDAPAPDEDDPPEPPVPEEIPVPERSLGYKRYGRDDNIERDQHEGDDYESDRELEQRNYTLPRPEHATTKFVGAGKTIGPHARLRNDFTPSELDQASVTSQLSKFAVRA